MRIRESIPCGSASVGEPGFAVSGDIGSASWFCPGVVGAAGSGIVVEDEVSIPGGFNGHLFAVFGAGGEHA